MSLCRGTCENEYAFFTIASPSPPIIQSFLSSVNIIVTYGKRYSEKQKTRNDRRDETAAGSRYGTADFEEIDQLLGDVNARNTHKTTKFAVKLFYDYCNSKGRNPEFKNLTAVQLNALLKEFYVNIRRVNGEHYNTSSLCIRHLSQPPHNKTFTILTGIRLNFMSQTMFSPVCVNGYERSVKGKSDTRILLIKVTLRNCMNTLLTSAHLQDC